MAVTNIKDINYPSYVDALLVLLDQIERETTDETTHALCKQRFQMAEDAGFTVEFGEGFLVDSDGPGSDKVQ